MYHHLKEYAPKYVNCIKMAKIELIAVKFSIPPMLQRWIGQKN